MHDASRSVAAVFLLVAVLAGVVLWLDSLRRAELELMLGRLDDVEKAARPRARNRPPAVPILKPEPKGA